MLVHLPLKPSQHGAALSIAKRGAHVCRPERAGADTAASLRKAIAPGRLPRRGGGEIRYRRTATSARLSVAPDGERLAKSLRRCIAVRRAVSQDALDFVGETPPPLGRQRGDAFFDMALDGRPIAAMSLGCFTAYARECGEFDVLFGTIVHI